MSTLYVRKYADNGNNVSPRPWPPLRAEGVEDFVIDEADLKPYVADGWRKEDDLHRLYRDGKSVASIVGGGNSRWGVAVANEAPVVWLSGWRNLEDPKRVAQALLAGYGA